MFIFLSGKEFRVENFAQENGRNFASPADEDRVNCCTEQIQLIACQTSSKAEHFSASVDKISVAEIDFLQQQPDLDFVLAGHFWQNVDDLG